jgi:hypothetical protein
VVLQKVGSRAEVWFANVVAAFARYVVERVMPISVPMLMREEAIAESFQFAKENLREAWPFLDRFLGLTTAIVEARKRFPDRHYVLEFGVFKGQMINYQAKRFSDLTFVGFDSFEGLGEAWKGVLQKGAFDLYGKPPKVRRNVSLIKGWFSDSLPGWKSSHLLSPGPLLVHIDCDTYGATIDVLNHCADYVEHGVILHFDDYFGHPNWKNAGHKALQEIAAQKDWKLTYLCYGTKEVGVFAEANEPQRLDS